MNLRNIFFPTLLALALGACGGGGEDDERDPDAPPVLPEFRVPGALQGLADGTSVVLHLTHARGGEDITVSRNGPFEFAAPVAASSTYIVSVLTQPVAPPRQNCLVNPAGTIDMSYGGGSPVQVNCVTGYVVGGTVNGLHGQGLVLELQTVPPATGSLPRVTEQLPIPASGPFTFTTTMEDLTGFYIKIVGQPQNPAQRCESTRAPLGMISGADRPDYFVIDCVDEVQEFPVRKWRMQVGNESVNGQPQAGFRVLAESPDYPLFNPQGSGKHTAEAGFLEGRLAPLFGLPDDDIAHSEVYSGRLGRTFWLTTEAPHVASSRFWRPDGSNDARTHYSQRQSYRKKLGQSALKLKIKDLLLAGYDFDSDGSSSGGRRGDKVLVWADVFVWVFDGTDTSETATVKDRQGLRVLLHGRHGAWEVEQFLDAESTGRVLSQDLFAMNALNFEDDIVGFDYPALGVGHGYGAEVSLPEPIYLDIDISGIQIGGEFTVQIQAQTVVHDPSDWEFTFAAAHLRDPAGTGGVGTPAPKQGARAPAGVEEDPDALGFGLVPVDLEVTNRPFLGEPEIPDPTPIACSAAVAGTVQFEQASYETSESTPYSVDPILITRTGGSRGELEVTVETTGGSATVNADYRRYSKRVRFGDGDTIPRLLELELLPDEAVEPDETITLHLSHPACGALGGTDSATLTLVDDDEEAATYSVGGAVSGLTGNGLVIGLSGEQLAPTNGEFTFPTELLDGWEYDVRIVTQPDSPRQVCTVANGQGTIASANVTDVAISCVDAPAPGSLDPTFGTGGIVTEPVLVRGAEEMAIQTDGRIVVADSSWRVARFGRDGALDTAFGTGGEVMLTFSGQSSDELRAIAIQPDGKIVVAGFSRPGISADDDFAVARLNPDGSLDSSFGSGGKLTTDFFGFFDRAHFVLIQADGKIVVGGEAYTSLSANSDLALVRYLSNGSLDTSFGSGGKVLSDLSARDAAYAAVLRPDGRILVGGGFGVSSTSNLHADSVLAQYLANGALDPSFGVGGLRGIDLSLGTTTGSVSDWIEGLALLDDGRIITIDGNGFRAARFTANGAPDVAFGDGGVATVDFTGQTAFIRGVAVQDDGRILLAGWVRVPPTGRSDLAIVRLDAGGSIDSAFASSGKLQVDFYGSDDGAFAIAPQDGRFVVAGLAISGSMRLAALLRLQP